MCRSSYQSVSSYAEGLKKHKGKAMIKFLFVALSVGFTPIVYADLSIVEKTNALMSKGELDAAEDMITSAIKKDSNNAALQHTAGMVFGQQAQNSSIFSAPGYAKKTLKTFKEAVRLEPSNPEYRMGLMAYYLMAPGIMGGDDDLGKAEAKIINELDPVKGFLATAMVFQSAEEKDKLKAHYDTAEQKFPQNAVISYNHAAYRQQLQEYQLAHKKFSDILELELSEDNKLLVHHARYQIGRTSVLSGANIDEGISALTEFLTQAPEHHQLPPKPWAKFRLALLHGEKGDKVKAKALMSEAKDESNDKKLKKEIKKAIKNLS